MQYSKIETDSNKIILVINSLRKRSEVLINAASMTKSENKAMQNIALAAELIELANELVSASNFPEYIGSKTALDRVIYKD